MSLILLDLSNLGDQGCGPTEPNKFIIQLDREALSFNLKLFNANIKYVHTIAPY